MVELAVLIAIVLVMAFTPLGYIKTFGLEITLIVVPVAIGAVILGPAAGLALGLTFGITSFIQCFGLSAFGAMLLTINPVACFIVCVPTRALMGWLAGMIFKGLKKSPVPHGVSTSIACLSAPLLNTALFMSTLVLFFYNTEYIQGFVTQMGSANAFLFVLAFVGVNGVVEAIASFVVGTAVCLALQKALHLNQTAAVL